MDVDDTQDSQNSDENTIQSATQDDDWEEVKTKRNKRNNRATGSRKTVTELDFQFDSELDHGKRNFVSRLSSFFQ